MKHVIYLKTKMLVLVIVCILPLLLLFNAGLNFLNGRDSGVFAASSGDAYETRTRLMMEAMQQTGVCDAAKAAQLWASGVKSQSAALQYAVLGKSLKKEYAEALQTTAPNWVTGASSPRVVSYTVKKQDSAGANSIFAVLFAVQALDGQAQTLSATITLSREGDFYTVTEIAADASLAPYTGFSGASQKAPLNLTITQ
jgi:hypothetical protein